MRGNPNIIDEQTLAGYLAGDLPPARRRQVTRYLAENEEARELVLVARELLDDQGWRSLPDDGLFTLRRLRLAVWIAGITMLVAAVAVTLLLAVRFREEALAVRTRPAGVEDASWSADLTVQSGRLRWDAIPGATYAVVFWDVERGVESLRVPVDGPAVDIWGLVVAESGRPHAVWIEAIAPGGAVIRKTPPIRLRPAP